MKFTTRPFSAAMLTALLFPAALISMPANAKEEKVLNIYNWSNYIAPDTIANFEKKTGIRVQYDTYDNNETLNAKILAGNSGYDIVVPSEGFAKLQIDAGLLTPIDKNKISNFKNINPDLLKKLDGIDPQNKHLIPWLWGYRTIAINREAVKKELGSMPLPSNPWQLVFDPTYTSKLKKCGISLFDSAAAVIPSALLYIGKNPASTDPQDYKKVQAMLKLVRKDIYKIQSAGYIDDLIGKNVCVAMGPSGDLNIAKYRAQEMKLPYHIDVLIPNRTSILFFDSMAIPKNAPHLENAYQFINYVLNPKVSASLTDAVFYANPTTDSKKYVSKKIAQDDTVYLSKNVLENIAPPIPLNESLRKLETKTFTNFKLGY